MTVKTIAILHPGEMGAAIGAGLVARGHRVVWVSAGRGSATRRRADENGLEDVETLARAARKADIALSVCPPHAALELAHALAACSFDGIYIDANAVSADTARAIGRVVEAAGADYVDTGIIGPPPVPGASVRLYLCGDSACEMAALFEGCIMQAIALDGRVGTASALKVCYAAWNKGATALLAAIRALAAREGVDAALIEEWNISMPDIPKRSQAVSASARKAWRWIAEMEEIAASFEAGGAARGFPSRSGGHLSPPRRLQGRRETARHGCGESRAAAQGLKRELSGSGPAGCRSRSGTGRRASPAHATRADWRAGVRPESAPAAPRSDRRRKSGSQWLRP